MLKERTVSFYKVKPSFFQTTHGFILFHLSAMYLQSSPKIDIMTLLHVIRIKLLVHDKNCFLFENRHHFLIIL